MDPSFVILPAAVQRLLFLSQQEGAPVLLRIRVDSGGCAGFQYHFDLEKTLKTPEDILFDVEGARVVIDSTSLELLKGAQLDYIEEMMEASFTIKNPNSTSSCGCGTSFSIF